MKFGTFKRGAAIAAIIMALACAGFFLKAEADNASGTVITQSLQDQIKQKQQQLNAVNNQLASTTAVLRMTQSERISLQQQVKLLNGNISSLNLGIQADTIKTQQLQLEEQQIQGNLQDIKASIDVKQGAIRNTLQELQRNEATNGNLLAVLLRNGTLADSVFAANTVANLQGRLTQDIENLKTLTGEYNGKLQLNNTKQVQVAVQQQDLKNKKSIVVDQQQQKSDLLATTKNLESVFQKQLKDLQKEQDRINSEIEAIDAVLRTKIDPSTIPRLGPGVLAIPIAGDTEASITQAYGATAFARSEYVHHWHNGLDLAASIGTPVLAAESGIVDAAANEDRYCPHGAYGRFVTINHTNGLTTLYAHLSRQLVQAGEHVVRGQIIGYSGQSGAVTGPHLHFTVFAQSTYYVSNSRSCGPLPQGGDLNPAGYLF